MVAIVDYGVGNLFSLQCSLNAIGAEITVTADPEVLKSADQVLLPGVGAFGDAAEKLRSTGLDTVLRDLAAQGKPLLGICLGMQLLFEKSYEYGEHTGLGLLQGQVVPMAGKLPAALKIPHMGWNQLKQVKECPILDGVDGKDFYFVHSYHAVLDDIENLSATADYGFDVTAAVSKDNVFATQFHPEKSGVPGLKILKNFVSLE